MQLHNRSKNEYGYVYCYLMLYRFIYGHSLSSYGTVPVLVSVDWPYSQQTRCWRKGHVFYFHYYYFLYIYIRRPPSSSAHHKGLMHVYIVLCIISYIHVCCRVYRKMAMSEIDILIIILICIQNYTCINYTLFFRFLFQ